MRILVTGGGGMVGSYLKDLAKEYTEHEFLAMTRSDCNLAERDEVKKYFHKLYKYFDKLGGFDCIIHLAAAVGGLFMNMDKGIKMFSENIRINENILEVCNMYGIQRGIFCLSSCIYTPNPSSFPMTEKGIHEGPPHPSNEGYAYAKRMMELRCRQYNKAYKREYICVIPVNLYGKYDNFNTQDGHVIPALMHRFYKGTMEAFPVHTVYGTGSPLRQFLYAGDFAELICRILLDGKYLSTEPIICCSDETSIREMVYTLARVMGIEEKSIVFETSMSDGCLRKTVDNSKLLKLYPNFRFKSLEDGLKITYDWFKVRYPDVRQ